MNKTLYSCTSTLKSFYWSHFTSEEKSITWLHYLVLFCIWLYTFYIHDNPGLAGIVFPGFIIQFGLLILHLRRASLRVETFVHKITDPCEANILSARTQELYQNVAESTKTYHNFKLYMSNTPKPEAPPFLGIGSGSLIAIVAVFVQLLDLLLNVRTLLKRPYTLHVGEWMVYALIFIVILHFRYGWLKNRFEKRARIYAALELLEKRLDALPAEKHDNMSMRELMMYCGILSMENDDESPRSSLLQTL